MKYISVVIALSILTSMGAAYHWRIHSMPYFLKVKAKSSTDSIAQVYYDIGKGFREKDSEKAVVGNSTDFEDLVFPLPARKIKSLRLDPMIDEGIIEIKSATIHDSQKVLRSIRLNADFKAKNDLTIYMSDTGTMIAKTKEGSKDPIIEITLSAPLEDWDVLAFFDGVWFARASFLSLVITPLILALALQNSSKTNRPDK